MQLMVNGINILDGVKRMTLPRNEEEHEKIISLAEELGLRRMDRRFFRSSDALSNGLEILSGRPYEITDMMRKENIPFIYPQQLIKAMEEALKKTPFQEAGYTDKSRFVVIKGEFKFLEQGGIVRLAEDNGTEEPLFYDQDGRNVELHLSYLNREMVYIGEAVTIDGKDYLEV